MNLKPIAYMMGSKYESVHDFGHYLAYLFQYINMYRTLVKDDLRGRFKNTALGYFWHLLNPLSQIIIYIVIFTVVFGKDISNYWVYISSGMFAYNFFMNCSAGGCNIITGKSNLVTKMTFAKEVLVASKVTSNFIVLLISYGLLLVLMIISGVGMSWSVFLVPIIVLIFAVFCTGLAFALSAITVYVRDIANIMSILLGCMMFAVPIMYMTSQMSSSILKTFWAVNPLYYYIETIHDAIYWGIMPDLLMLSICIVSAIVAFITGLYIFKRLEGGFAERL